MKLILRVVILSWPVLFSAALAQSQFARQPAHQEDPLLGVDGGARSVVTIAAAPAHWAEGNLPLFMPPGR